MADKKMIGPVRAIVVSSNVLIRLRKKRARQARTVTDPLTGLPLLSAPRQRGKIIQFPAQEKKSA